MVLDVAITLEMWSLRRMGSLMQRDLARNFARVVVEVVAADDVLYVCARRPRRAACSLDVMDVATDACSPREPHSTAKCSSPLNWIEPLSGVSLIELAGARGISKKGVSGSSWRNMSSCGVPH